MINTLIQLAQSDEQHENLSRCLYNLYVDGSLQSLSNDELLMLIEEASANDSQNNVNLLMTYAHMLNTQAVSQLQQPEQPSMTEFYQAPYQNEKEDNEEQYQEPVVATPKPNKKPGVRLFSEVVEGEADFSPVQAKKMRTENLTEKDRLRKKREYEQDRREKVTLGLMELKNTLISQGINGMNLRTQLDVIQEAIIQLGDLYEFKQAYQWSETQMRQPEQTASAPQAITIHLTAPTYPLPFFSGHMVAPATVQTQGFVTMPPVNKR